ncbi:IS3 family transposase, partial [Endozoicomonas sp. SM1973]|nr:IS3 family transposase [Spartinivicinus marinus]
RLLCQRASLRFEFIHQHRGQFSIKALCRCMSVSPSGYYDWRSRPVSKRAQKDEVLKAKIKKSHEASHRNYGTRRIKDDLADQDEQISRRRIGRLMKEEGLSCKTKRKFKATTDSKHNKPVAENLLNRQFSWSQPDQAYVGDITYIPTHEGWLYLAVFIDLCSRAVVGWSMSHRMTASLVTDALQMAIKSRKP